LVFGVRHCLAGHPVFLWMLSLSLKFEVDNAASAGLYPQNFAWKNYADVLASNRFLTYFVTAWW